MPFQCHEYSFNVQYIHLFSQKHNNLSIIALSSKKNRIFFALSVDNHHEGIDRNGEGTRPHVVSVLCSVTQFPCKALVYHPLNHFFSRKAKGMFRFLPTNNFGLHHFFPRRFSTLAFPNLFPGGFPRAAPAMAHLMQKVRDKLEGRGDRTPVAPKLFAWYFPPQPR